jgi:hypothetical protein
MNTNIIHQPFEEDGFIGPLNILTPHEARQALHQVQNELSKENAIDSNSIYSYQPSHPLLMLIIHG